MLYGLLQGYLSKNKAAIEKNAKEYSSESETKKIESERNKADKELERRCLQMEKEDEEKKLLQEADDAYNDLLKKNTGTVISSGRYINKLKHFIM